MLGEVGGFAAIVTGKNIVTSASRPEHRCLRCNGCGATVRFIRIHDGAIARDLMATRTAIGIIMNTMVASSNEKRGVLAFR